MQHTNPSLVISLDFELMWGVRDKQSIGSYGKNVLGVREAIPAMLRLFEKYDVKATWATVGMLLFRTKRELIAELPNLIPSYDNSEFSPYKGDYLAALGADEKSDPYHFGFSLAEQIVASPGMELASHTFSHYYCREDGQNAAQFRADLQASVKTISRLAPSPLSIVFPRNQCLSDYIAICAELGFRAYRGNETSWIYRDCSDQEQTFLKRGARLLDAYCNVSGDNGFLPSCIHGIVNIPSSRFLRPYSIRFHRLEHWRIHRILRAMTSTAQASKSFHLWWHPHNFGMHLRQNLAVLEEVLARFAKLRRDYGVQSVTMAEMAAQTTGQAA